MNSFAKITLALLAAAFVSSTPAIAADATTPATQKPDLSSTLKDKASDIVEQGKDKADNLADNLQKSIGKNEKTSNMIEQGKEKADNLADDLQKSLGKDQAKKEILDVTQENVTVETPNGIANETTTIITPEGKLPVAPVPAAK